MTIEAELQQAIAHHNANRIEQAGQLYHAILSSEPDHPDANHNFGVLLLQKGDVTGGLSHLQAAVSAAPERRNFWVNYVNVLTMSGRQEEAQRASAAAREHGFVIGTAGAAAPAATPETPEPLEALAQQGRHDEAEALARQRVEGNPDDALAWKTLAYAQLRRGDLSRALGPLEEAARLLPNDAELDRHRYAARAMHDGLALEACHEYAEAAQRFQAVVDTYPDHPDANHRLGAMAIHLCHPEDAIPLIEKAIGINPNNLQYWAHYIDALLQADRVSAAWLALNMAQKRGLAGPQIDKLISLMTFVSTGQLLKVPRPIPAAGASAAADAPAGSDEAAAHTTPAEADLRLSPEDEQHLHELVKLYNAGDMETVLKQAQAVARRLPRHPFPGKVLTLTYHRLGQYDVALENGLKTLELSPDDPQVLLIVAGLYQVRHNMREAARHCERLVKLAPGNSEALRLMGVIKVDLGELDEAERLGRLAIDIQPGALAYNSLGVALMKQGRLDEAGELFRRSSELDPDAPLPYHNFAFCSTHSEKLTPQEIFGVHRRFSAHFEAPLKPRWQPHDNSRDPERPLRIGFISGDFCHHAVASFIEPVLGPLGRDPGLSLHAYSNTSIIDEVTPRLRAQFSTWTDIVGMDNRRVAEQIRRDGIDILIDLAGHTASNSLLALAYKPAPIQACWIGYPGTTGLDAVDYFLADRFWVPPAQFRDQFTEQIVYLPALAPFEPERLSPPVNLLPALHNGYVTFGSFNRLDKLRRDVIGLWAKLLRALPDSRLMIGAMPTDGSTGKVADWFAEEGIASERIDYKPRSSVPVFLQQHHFVDICLDSFPFSGLTTALHSLWMGLPTVTLPSHTVPGRSGLTAMSHAGLTQCVATDEDDYVRKAVALASDLPALAALRTGMRERCAGTPMFQPERIAESVSRALRTMWRRWCANLPAESFEVEPSDKP
ncbi:O-linked N-acetylglucosamine transferase family protein [Paraburkholderia acidipaludis]|uniref:O-linked N-acetylglucosamine transferase family protein n=1 Tax=Paraburkholderia acidipaludis TaxID=660537 RepID=UPI00069467F0|nr:tetratricopeptide repeat protein [Paraburkholderia acidipaludis]